MTLEVTVRGGNIEHALKFLKKKLQREGLLRKMKLHRYYEKPSERKKRERSETLRRSRKVMRKRPSFYI